MLDHSVKISLISKWCTVMSYWIIKVNYTYTVSITMITCLHIETETFPQPNHLLLSLTGPAWEGHIGQIGSERDPSTSAGCENMCVSMCVSVCWGYRGDLMAWLIQPITNGCGYAPLGVRETDPVMHCPAPPFIINHGCPAASLLTAAWIPSLSTAQSHTHQATGNNSPRERESMKMQSGIL
jgi:hypothetical protein